MSPHGLSVLLAHPGGPFFIHKDAGSWTIPKGLADPGEAMADAARREFEEEVGWRPAGDLTPLGEVKLRSGKRVIAFALQSDEPPEISLARFSPGLFAMEWPRGSQRLREFPEVDRIEFFSIDAARRKISPAQEPLLDRLIALHANDDCR
jgi:predicted NUDIX family NTP pyrophosphohydrolase